MLRPVQKKTLLDLLVQGMTLHVWIVFLQDKTFCGIFLVFSMEQAEDIHLMLEHIITTCLRNGTAFTGNICRQPEHIVAVPVTAR